MAATEKPVMSDSNKLFIIIATVVAGWLFYLLSPVLMPFFIAALLAYLGDPVVDKLESWKLSRTLSVSIVFAVLLLIALAILLIFLPLLFNQIGSLVKRLPDYLELFQSTVIPWLSSVGVPIEIFDINTFKQALTKYLSEIGQVTSNVLGYMTRSGVVILQWVTTLFLVPVIAFYLLRDWDLFIARFKELLPRRYAKDFVALVVECNEMLAAFIHGQLMVMLALTIIYTIGLTMIGLELGLLIGVISGIVSFVPYLGLIVGISLAGIAAFLQFHEWLPVLMVVIVFSAAQTLEGTVLTPHFVGERIGLHPVAVLFAVMAGAQLFGFIGVLLALPVAAVAMVLLRHAHQKYLTSELYS
ncbi:MAG: AI-2E family transporter [Gammaproteobacteria bacterium]|nr:MAG: AI-2E family transporter [Gammaproteobacteria bacterium]RKZ94383.1 MAG: AI-2E family transporter [Gammaproteobacteria bacterium]